MTRWKLVPQGGDLYKVYRDGVLDGTARKRADGSYEPVSSAGAFPQAMGGRRTGSAVATRHRPSPSVKRPARSVAATPPWTPPPSSGRYVVLPVTAMLGTDVRAAAQEAADRCAAELGVKRVSVRFFADATEDVVGSLLVAGHPAPERFDAEPCLGIFRPELPNAVYLKATDSVVLAAEVAAHEVRHKWQTQAWGRPMSPADEATYEDDARRYGEAYREAVGW